MNLVIQVPDNLILRGRGLRTNTSAVGLGDVNLTAGGDFTLVREGTAPPVLIGTIETVRGNYDFQGRRFQVLRDGTITFRGETPVDPALNVTAERVISGIVAHVTVSGTMREPQVALSSQPPLDQADILSLIVFNQPANRLGQGEATNLGERAAQLAGGFVVTPLADTVGRALNVDIFEVDPSGDEGEGPTVTLGQQVGERLFLKFRQIFGAREVSEFQLEYQLADFLRLEGSFAEGPDVREPLAHPPRRARRHRPGGVFQLLGRVGRWDRWDRRLRTGGLQTALIHRLIHTRQQVGLIAQLAAEARVAAAPGLEVPRQRVEQIGLARGPFARRGAAEERRPQRRVPLDVVAAARLVLEEPGQQQALRRRGLQQLRVVEHRGVEDELIEDGGQRGRRRHVADALGGDERVVGQDAGVVEQFLAIDRAVAHVLQSGHEELEGSPLVDGQKFPQWTHTPSTRKPVHCPRVHHGTAAPMTEIGVRARRLQPYYRTPLIGQRTRRGD